MRARTRAAGIAAAMAAVISGVTLVIAGQTSAGNSGGDGAIPNEMAGYRSVVERGAPPAGPTGHSRCVDGMAAGLYPCDGIDMLSHVPAEELGLSFVNDMWGWTDPRTRKDYALVGGTEGTVIVDISRATRPRVIGMLPTHSPDPNAPFWRDIKVFRNHLYTGSEEAGHGIQVLDLTEVRRVPRRSEPVVFEETAHYAELSSSHNLNINKETGMLYAVGTRNPDRTPNCGTGLHMIDINEPANPTFAGCYEDEGYIHDTQCVVYRGPDREHRGQEICFNSNAAVDGHFVSVVDVTDKSNPVELARMPYEQFGYSHQGWLTPNQRYFLHNDELDEVDHGINTTTRLWDMRDLDNPVMTLAHDHGTTSIGHNVYTEGNRAYASNYTSGLRVLDTSDVSNADLTDIAYFDMYPENDDATFEGGTWSNYPYFSQRGIVGVSSIDRGLFVLKPQRGR